MVKKKKIGLSVLIVLFLCLMTAALLLLGRHTAVHADGETSESYRNRLAYSAARGWNNDPNGLIYADGTYHMYYQYNWNAGEGETENVWGHMSWGHATSTDLVHWTERPVALPEGKNGYGMMFSGSCVYDGDNTSGLFDTDEGGKVRSGQGIVALLTQPEESAGGQRQILAYSKDGGTSFSVYGEVLAADADGTRGDGEFRDPKVFWYEEQHCWIMAVGGGSIRMYSSPNLKDWRFVGSTGFWGECPDLSRFEADGQTKYVLVFSPEDKTNSHLFNGTTRADTFYPAEYYVVGKLNSAGLFVAEGEMTRLDYGVDSYAFQSFNGVPGGKVYGISWGASWKNVGDYLAYRKNYNGGMTIACELNLAKEGGKYVVRRTPVAGYEGLRKGNALVRYQGNLAGHTNLLSGVKADLFDLNAKVNFAGSSATYCDVKVRLSQAEETVLHYDRATETLVFDGSHSSLLAENVLYATLVERIPVPLQSDVLDLRIIGDRAFISVFANGRSLFSAIFPSAVSDGMSFDCDAGVGVDVAVYALNGAYGYAESENELLLTADKLDVAVGGSKKLVASSFHSSFAAGSVNYTVTEGEEHLTIRKSGGILTVTGVSKGTARIGVECAGYPARTVTVYVSENGYDGDLSFTRKLNGYSYYNESGFVYEGGEGDGLVFSETSLTQFVLDADLTVLSGQACGIVFGASENYFDYYVLTADVQDGVVKLWRSGTGDLSVASHNFSSGSCHVRLSVKNNELRVTVDGEKDLIVYGLADYKGGYLGFNTYKSSAAVNHLRLLNEAEKLSVTFLGEEAPVLDLGLGGAEVLKVVNLTDASYKLVKDTDYSLEEGKLVLHKAYLLSLASDGEYLIRAVTEEQDFDCCVVNAFAGVTAKSTKNNYFSDEAVVLTLSEGAVVRGIRIDGILVKEGGYSVDGSTVTISVEALKDFTFSDHEIVVYTDEGRPSVTVALSQAYVRVAEEETANHVFLCIDLVIFGSLIVGYVGFTVYKKMKKKKAQG